MKIDGIDKIIIRKLMNDARTPVLSIAREVGISGAAIHQRIKKLEKSKLIESYKLIIDTNALGYKITVFIGISLDSEIDFQSILKKIKLIPEIIESHYTTGNFELFIKLICKNNKELVYILNNKIKAIHGVQNINVFMSLNQHINRQIKI